MDRRREAIMHVRSFNRTVTQRVGALNERYLARNRPLGEARVLWELGDGGCDVRRLRTLLGLDSGYLSRLLRSLEGDGLVTMIASPRDGRVRTARLTRRGKAERTLLDRRSDELAWSMLEPLAPPERDRLVTAMRDVVRLLTAAELTIETADPAAAEARYCVGEYFAELGRRFPIGFDPDTTRPADAAEMRAPRGQFLIARLHGEPVGCGGLKFHPDRRTELKRMWVAPSARGLGVGRRLLAALEEAAAAHKSTAVRLDTNSALVEAIAMYRSSGYREVEAFNDEFYADHWFEKKLRATGPVRSRR